MKHYDRSVDKSLIPVVNIMGVNIAAINMKWLLQYTRKNIKKIKGDYICVSNVHTTVMSYEDASYRKIQNNALLAIPDGAPLSFVGRKRGALGMKRVTGPDYMKKILKASKRNGWKHFFYGSTQETLDKMKKVIEEDYPGAEIVGMYSPPFRELTKQEDDDIINMINETNPDFVWIGLGAPKQERWMASHKGKLNGLMVGVGAAFDYCAGNIKRAPKWMQKSGLEWLYRLMQDPQRLFKRYFVTNTKFILNAIVKGK